MKREVGICTRLWVLAILENYSFLNFNPCCKANLTEMPLSGLHQEGHILGFLGWQQLQEMRVSKGSSWLWEEHY